MEIGEVLRREKESFDLGFKVGIIGVLWFESVAGLVIFGLVSLIRVWF